MLLLGLFSALSFFLLSPGESKAAGSTAGPQAVDDPQYVGSETCQACHDASFQSWEKTAMRRAFLDHAKTPLEGKGCEACHGPGRAHVEGQGDLAAIIRFGKNSNLPVEAQNTQCLQCHEKGKRLFWQGSKHESRGLAWVNCHQVTKPNVPSLRFDEPLSGNRQFLKQTKMEVYFQCHLQRRAQVYRSTHMPFCELS